jgi:hypothetical protein
LHRQQPFLGSVLRGSRPTGYGGSPKLNLAADTNCFLKSPRISGSHPCYLGKEANSSQKVTGNSVLLTEDNLIPVEMSFLCQQTSSTQSLSLCDQEFVFVSHSSQVELSQNWILM